MLRNRIIGGIATLPFAITLAIVAPDAYYVIGGIFIVGLAMLGIASIINGKSIWENME